MENSAEGNTWVPFLTKKKILAQLFSYYAMSAFWLLSLGSKFSLFQV